MTSITTLGKVMGDPFAFKFNDSLYMDPDSLFKSEASILVHEIDDVHEDADLPKAELDLGCEYVLDIQAVRSIVENAKSKKSEVTIEELL